MNCPRCGKAIAGGAAFCMHCGQALAAQPQRPMPQQPVYQQPSYQAPSGGGPAAAFPMNPADANRKQTVLAISVALALIVLLLFGLNAVGILKLGGGNPDRSNLQARGSTGDSALKLKGNTGPPSLKASATNQKPAEMPQDVWDWLEHLRITEGKKNELHLRQVADLKKFELMIGTLGPAIGELNPYDQSGELGEEPTDVAEDKFADLRPEWHALIKFFQSKPPPEECKPIADDYFRAINEIPGMTGDVIGVLNTVSRDPSSALAAASKLRNKSYDNIDRYLIQTDKRVQDICDKYRKDKWFNIKTDVAGSGLLGKAGF
jgi:hypothetical protein